LCNQCASVAAGFGLWHVVGLTAVLKLPNSTLPDDASQLH